MKLKEFSAPCYMDVIRKTWIIGGDLGDLVYFYGEGKEGFGFYRGDAAV